MKESAKKYLWLKFDQRGPINWDDARKIEAEFYDEHKDVLRPLITKEICPFCNEEVEDCECGAKPVYWSGGQYCPMCESTHYYTRDTELVDAINKHEEMNK